MVPDWFRQLAQDLCLRVLAAPLMAVALAGSPAWGQSADPTAYLLVETSLCDLGQLSPGDPSQSSIQAGKVRVRVLSLEDWSLETRLGSPFQRESDGQELQFEDPARATPPLTPDLLLGHPVVAASGEGSRDERSFEVDVWTLGAALETTLESDVPPGAYRAVVLARLVDGQGQSLAEAEPVTVRFELVPWAGLTPDIPPVEFGVHTLDWNTLLEGEPTVVRVAGNSTWQLRVARAGELVNEQSGAEVPGVRVSAQVPGDLPPGAEPVMSGYLMLGEVPAVIVRGGAAEAPGDLLQEIPVLIRLESDDRLLAGRYRIELVFDIAPEASLP
jgi:hypothetical protein